MTLAEGLCLASRAGLQLVWWAAGGNGRMMGSVEGELVDMITEAGAVTDEGPPPFSEIGGEASILKEWSN